MTSMIKNSKGYGTESILINNIKSTHQAQFELTSLARRVVIQHVI